MVLDGQCAGLRRRQRRAVAKEMGRAGAARRRETLLPQRSVQIRIKHLPSPTDDVTNSRAIVPLPTWEGVRG